MIANQTQVASSIHLHITVLRQNIIADAVFEHGDANLLGGGLAIAFAD